MTEALKQIWSEKYTKHYEKLVARARSRKIMTSVEFHHVIPKCMGGTEDDSNYVALTMEEHYIAHLLLTKMYPDHQGLKHAAMMMAARSNKVYGWVRRQYSESKKGKPWPGVRCDHVGRKRSAETRAKMSAAQKGKIMSITSIDKIRNTLKGRKPPPITEEGRKRISEARKGKPFSEEHKANLRKAKKAYFERKKATA